VTLNFTRPLSNPSACAFLPSVIPVKKNEILVAESDSDGIEHDSSAGLLNFDGHGSGWLNINSL
jgi:hypothetical protein